MEAIRPYSLILSFFLCSPVCFADTTGNLSGPAQSSFTRAANPTNFYDACVDEFRSAKVLITQAVQEICRKAEQKDFILEFNQCLKERPRILEVNSRFIQDCLELAEKGTAPIYTRCLKKIERLNIESIGSRFLTLAYNSSVQQCDQMLGCLAQYQNKGLQIGPSAVSQCSRQTAISEERSRPADPSFANLEKQNSVCMFDKSGQQIRQATNEEHKSFMANYVDQISVHWNAGPCERPDL